MTDAEPAPPFDRVSHCQRIAAHGGATTAARHGSQHFRAIGKAGAQVTIAKHGVAYFQGLMQRRGWAGRRTDTLAADLAVGRFYADQEATR